MLELKPEIKAFKTIEKWRNILKDQSDLKDINFFTSEDQKEFIKLRRKLIDAKIILDKIYQKTSKTKEIKTLKYFITIKNKKKK